MVLAAGVAQAEVTFSGKAEAGVSRVSSTAAVTAVTGVKTVSGAATATAAGIALTTGATTAATTVTAADAASIAAALVVLNAAKVATEVAQRAVNADSDGTSTFDTKTNTLVAAQAAQARAQAAYDANVGTVAAAKGATADMKAYSGYDMEVAVSSTLDNGMVVSAGFDMGAGSIADRDDDRVLDAQAAAVALSAVTIKNGGVTYVIGQDKIDDLYDDTQNGDVSVSGAMGGISYTLVTDLDKDTKAVAASTVTQDALLDSWCSYIRRNSRSSSRTRINIVETVWCSSLV